MVDAIEQTIEGKKLSESQKEAIREPGENICANAGAGSGKTLTILGKIIHILDKKSAKPEEILVMAFNRSVAIQLRKRVNALSKEFPDLLKDLEKISITKGPERKIHTFHSFCYDELIKKSNKTLANHLKTQENKQKKKANEDNEYYDEIDARAKCSKFYNDLIEDLVSKDKKFSKLLIQYFLKYLERYKDPFKDIKSMKDYTELIERKLKPLKSPKFKVGTVRSVEECEIANFLFLRGIEYIYEDPYPKDKIPESWTEGYKPDFHLIKKDEKGNIIYDVYIEHFALDKNGNPPYFFTDRDYKKKYFDKINLHKSNNTKLITTYSHQKLDGTLQDHLTKELRQIGIDVPDKNVISDKEALKAFKKNKSSSQFIRLIENFLTNSKTREITIEKIKKGINVFFEGYAKERASAFVNLFETFYVAYHDNLKLQSENGAVDFEDMLILGRKYVDLENLKFLIVDEFQDISPLRASVIQNLRKKHSFKLFCVGDDWQSIYRFTGGEIGIMVFESEFEKYFGKRKIVDLEYTYRFGSRLCEAATNFILTNEKGQLKKAVKSIKTDNRPPIEIFLQEGVDNDFSVRKHVIKKLDELFEIHKNDEKPIKILFLSRFKTNTYYNFYDDLRQLVMRIFANKKFVLETMDYIRFSTVHKAKGVECDYVFLMNINNTRLGFPCNIDDDEILKLIINHIDAFPYEEERRTFYVALTRTKNRVFVYATKGDEISSFINEISGDQLKENYHYISTEIEPLPKPKVLLEISSFRNIKNIKKEDHPAKKKGLEKDFLIEEINETKHPTKDKFYREVRNSKGKDITLLIRTHQNEPEVMKIKPINLSDEEDEEKYSLGFYVREIEQDPLFSELTDKYKKISKKRKSDKQ